MIDLEQTRLPIGAIVRMIEARLAEEIGDQYVSGKSDTVAAIYEEFDVAFQQRPDYRLWRAALVPYFSFNKPLLAGRPSWLSATWSDWSAAAWQCMKSTDPLVIWSVIGLAPELIVERGRFARSAEHHPIWAFIDVLQRRLTYELEPLPQCPASCAMAAVAFLTRHQNIHYKAGRRFDLQGCAEFFRTIESWLAIVDQCWKPGQRLDTTAIQLERAGVGRLRAAHDTHEFSTLAEMLGVFRPILSQTVTQLNPLSEELLTYAYNYALTAWLTARSRRIDETLFQQRRGRNGGYRGQQKIMRAFEEEFDCHLKLTNAARDAGEYLEAARGLYLLYRLIPDRFLDLPKVRDELGKRSGTVRYLKEAGFEIDPRFASNKESNWIQTSTQQNAKAMIDRWRAMQQARTAANARAKLNSANDVSELRPEASPSDTGFMLRVQRDQSNCREWKAVFAEVKPPSHESPAGFLLTVMKSLADCGAEARPETLRAAFSLALKYGYVRSAGKILMRAIHDGDFQLSRTHLLDFVHNVKRCTQLDPFGIRRDRLLEWQTFILEGCKYLQRERGQEWMDASDRLWIHETVINRSHTHHRSLKFENAARLYEKSYGSYDVEELREFYDNQVNFGMRTMGVVNVPQVSEYCRKFEMSALGAPVAISLMAMGDVISIIGIGSDKQSIIYRDLEVPELASDIETALSGAEFWFKFSGVEPVWPRSIRALAAEIRAIGKACDPRARVVFVSMDSDLAQLPWQHLMLQGGDEGWLVSVVPSLSALTMRVAAVPMPGLELILSEEPCEEIAQIVEVIRNSTRLLSFERSSVSIVAGHGSPPIEGELPGVRIGPKETIASLDDWMSVMGARVFILHCCHAGTPKPVFTKEFGGAPGLAISLGAETFLAPVSEVSVAAASVLQNALFESPTDEIGIAYLNAVRGNSECCLYNLYGNPYERLIPDEMPALAFDNGTPDTACPIVERQWAPREGAD